MAEYFKGVFPGWSHSANPSWAGVTENGSIFPKRHHTSRDWTSRGRPKSNHGQTLAEIKKAIHKSHFLSPIYHWLLGQHCYHLLRLDRAYWRWSFLRVWRIHGSMWLHFTQPTEFLLQIASSLYAVVMMGVLIGTIIEIINDGFFGPSGVFFVCELFIFITETRSFCFHLYSFIHCIINPGGVSELSPHNLYTPLLILSWGAPRSVSTQHY